MASKQTNREKFYTVSARLVFSGLIVALILLLVLGLSVAINKGPVFPLLGVIGVGTSTYPGPNSNPGGTAGAGSPIVVEVTCTPTYPYGCHNPYFNYTTGILTVAISQNTGYNWTAITVRFVPAGTTYSHGVPELSWAPPAAVNVTGGLMSNTTKYVNIPINSSQVAVGTNITGSIWAKYQLQVGGSVSYANMSSAFIAIKR